MNPANITVDQLAGLIDHAVLKPTSTPDDLRAGCKLVRRVRAASICVRPCDVPAATAMLEDTGVPVGTVIGFPLGHDKTVQKVAQARQAIADGAWDLDMVINIGQLIAGNDQSVRDEIAAVVAAADGRVVKVILECAYLNADQIRRGCQAALDAQADFVKTSTGFAASGAAVEDVKLMAQCVGKRLGVKASGGIGDLATARAMLAAGATRLGSSRTAEILDELAGGGE